MPEESEKTSKKSDFKSKLYGPIIATIGTIVVAGIGFAAGHYDRIIQTRNVDVQVMKIALEILKSPIEITNRPYRVWACQILSEKSEQTIDCNDENAVSGGIQSFREFKDMKLGDKSFGDPTLTDLGIYVCKNDAQNIELARLAAGQLRDEGFGNIGFKKWVSLDEIALDDLKGYTTIVFDKGHDEMSEINRIKSALDSDLYPTIITTENSRKLTEWFLSIVICKA